jgi:hypothetical protein
VLATSEQHGLHAARLSVARTPTFVSNRISIEVGEVDMISFLGWSGTVLGCVGALLVALKLPASRYAYVCYLVANALLISYATLRADYPVLVLNLGLTLISLLGLWRWFRTRETRGPVEVSLACEQFARQQRAARAVLGPRYLA